MIGWRAWRWKDIGLNTLSDRSLGLAAVFANKISNGNSREKSESTLLLKC